MKKLKIFLLISVLGLLFSCTTQNTKLNTESPYRKQVDSILNLMTLDEKIGQTVLFTSGWDVTGPSMNDNYKEYIKQGKVGAVFNAFTTRYTKELQQIAVEETRLGIPLLFGYDVIHGHRTIFPIPLAESCSWDMKLIEKSARIAATEASAEGIHWTFAPMVDIARDPRWGRISEGAGEDTYLGSRIAKARVRGFQGDNLSKENTILACAKHFAAYGAAQAGRDYHTVDMSERELRSIYLPPFKAAVDEGVATFMTSFNELDGIPASANTFLLKDILRNEWGFKGFVVTDYTSINEMIPHGYAKDEKHAGELATNAGVDMDMQGSVYLNHLKLLIEEGKVSEEQINSAVRRILEMKFSLGLFDNPYRYIDPEREKETVLSKHHLETARKVARESMVLLKNENHLLPLSKEKKIALIGPLANDEASIIGNWSAAGDRKGAAVSVLEGFIKKIGEENIRYEKGCEIIGGDFSRFNKAVEVTRNSDVIVMVMGEHQNMSGEAASRTNLSLPGLQRDLIKSIKKTGKPIVLILMNGRPLTLTWEDQNVAAILETWFPGTMGGHAVADIIFGDDNPSGKLTTTFPRNVGQIPVYYNMKNTGRPIDPNKPDEKYKSKYLDVSNKPLYPFGYGLSYTSFTYDVNINDKVFRPNSEIIVSAKITNTGDYDGEEIAQLYIHDKVRSITPPLKELKGFKKISLKKGESKTITFSISTNDLRFYDQEMNYRYEPGEFELFVGGSSDLPFTHSFELMELNK